MILIKTEEIIDFARDIRTHWGQDPFTIAEKLGIVVSYLPGKKTDAYLLRANNYPMMINIVGCDSEVGRTVLCAHELGHALLHENTVNRFAGTYESIMDEREYEANLFAVALLFNEDEFCTPISKMNNYTLKGILDYNLE